MSASAAESGCSGFSLVEFLVGFTLCSLVMALTFDGLRSIARTHATLMRSAEHTEQMAAAEALVRRTLSEAYPLFVTEHDGKGHVVFEGSRDTVRYLARPPAALGATGRSHALIHKVRGPDGYDLRVDFELGGETHGQTLVRSLQDIEWAYFGTARGETAAAWRSEWKEQAELPVLVRMHLVFRADDRRVWPPIVVAPKIRTDVACQFDPLTKRCRGR